MLLPTCASAALPADLQIDKIQQNLPRADSISNVFPIITESFEKEAVVHFWAPKTKLESGGNFLYFWLRSNSIIYISPLTYQFICCENPNLSKPTKPDLAMPSSQPCQSLAAALLQPCRSINPASPQPQNLK